MGNMLAHEGHTVERKDISKLCGTSCTPERLFDGPARPLSHLLKVLGEIGYMKVNVVTESIVKFQVGKPQLMHNSRPQRIHVEDILILACPS